MWRSPDTEVAESPEEDSLLARSDALPRGTGVSADRFRTALGTHAAGVVVVTAAPGEDPVGVTATSFTSVSVDPPLVSFYINAGSNTWPGIRSAETFAVNILGQGQHATATRFATTGIDRFASPTRWHRGPEGLPLLEGAAAHVLCLHHESLAVGDHWLVVGKVARTAADGESTPLLYHRGRYGRFEP
ncbi:flavin reductase (DIM6/NTAB) family NADH-FMN oxidoreductase RutF [Haloactinospora alba]|uniref:Flavin reductase (DIM6/NTAB) family NADH-FMN oxidoreductase RutF n=1 Tax=Haloactinospora alba TaxID=405555 RepID=A0A543NI53_9ACTN|nr:flavin reductase (DIM6/NTAB) family NADH-FMN oxidoreductase RutF [Haloactinospora alba]